MGNAEYMGSACTAVVERGPRFVNQEIQVLTEEA